LKGWRDGHEESEMGSHGDPVGHGDPVDHEETETGGVYDRWGSAGIGGGDLEGVNPEKKMYELRRARLT
jgi:hypothetical protein